MRTNDLVSTFVRQIKTKADETARVASFGNSFEGWLKFELGAALIEQWKRWPWTDQSAAAKWGTIGMEYKVPLETRRSIQARKHVDLWVCGTSEKRWIYVELKVAFANGNAGKQIASWRSDLSLLGCVDDRACEGRVVLLTAIGFDRPALDDVVAQAGKSARTHWIRDSSGKGPRSLPALAVVSEVG